MEKRPLLLCTDPGIDDFIALSMVLARPEFDVLGMIALSGNVGLDVTVNNALLACELNGRSDIPVFGAGAKENTPHKVRCATWKRQLAAGAPGALCQQHPRQKRSGEIHRALRKGSPACLKRRRFHFANGRKIRGKT